VSSATGAFVSTTWTHDAAGRPATESDPNGASVTFSFNPDDTLGSQVLKNGGGATLSSFGYSYDADYRQTAQTFSGVGSTPGSLVTGTFNYAYDRAGRLSSFSRPGQTQSITWDHDSNRLTLGSQRFSYNADDSIESAPGGDDSVDYTYLAFGGVSSDGCTTFTYDGFDRLSQAQGQSVTGCPAPKTTAYAYDALDRQRSRTESGATTAFHYDGLDAPVSLKTASSIDTAYELGSRGEPKALKVASGTPAIEHLSDDGFGNVATVTSTAASVTCTVRYDPFGTPVGPQATDNPCNTGPKPASDLFYRGGRRDPSTGAYQLGSRTYDPAKAGFLTPDSYRNGTSAQDLSVGTDPLTLNRYSYVNGDPVNLVDPDGHYACESCGGAGDASVDQGCLSPFGCAGLGTIRPLGDIAEDVLSLAWGLTKGAAVGVYRSAADCLGGGSLRSCATTFGAVALAATGAGAIASSAFATGVAAGVAAGATIASGAFSLGSFAETGDPLDLAFGALDLAGGSLAARSVGALDEAEVFTLSRAERGIGAQGERAISTRSTPAWSGPMETRFGPGAAPQTGGGLFRRTANSGAFAELEVPMQLREVRRVAQQAGVGLDGVKVRIIRDPELIGSGFYGHTPTSGRFIDLYPDAFTNQEQLVRTLGHERMHVYQTRTFGAPIDSKAVNIYEEAARGSESGWWSFFTGGGR
jgi:RHS repeat-associated protein